MEARSESRLVDQELQLLYRVADEDAWHSKQLERQVGDSFLGRLPSYPKGAKVEYYLRAADHSGRAETLPRVAPAGVYRFTQELELTGKVVEKATSGIKQTMNTQV